MYSTQILPLNQLQRESERRRSLLLYLLPRVWISQFDRKSLWSVSQPLTIIVIQHKQLKSTVLLSLLLLVECESCKTARFNWVSQNVLERLDKTTKQYENTSYLCKTWRIDFYLLGLYSDQPKNAQIASLVNQK